MAVESSETIDEAMDDTFEKLPGRRGRAERPVGSAPPAGGWCACCWASERASQCARAMLQVGAGGAAERNGRGACSGGKGGEQLLQ